MTREVAPAVAAPIRAWSSNRRPMPVRIHAGSTVQFPFVGCSGQEGVAADHVLSDLCDHENTLRDLFAAHREFGATRLHERGRIAPVGLGAQRKGAQPARLGVVCRANGVVCRANGGARRAHGRRRSGRRRAPGRNWKSFTLPRIFGAHQNEASAQFARPQLLERIIRSSGLESGGLTLPPR